LYLERSNNVDERTREAEWAAWMQAAASGDAVAYQRFLVAVTPHLKSVVRNWYRKVSASDGDAEDIVQEALLAIHLKRGTWDQLRPIGPWIAAIVRNKLVDTLRRGGRRAAVPIDDVIDIIGSEDCAAGLPSGEIDSLLAKLTGQQREIVQSISINGSSTRETAGKLNMTEGAVRVALHRGLKKLAMLYQNRTS
jgi:RNA polymerase sigma factor (sigma-70 family)